MARTMGVVDMRDSIPEWAQEYAVGDEIAFRHPDRGKVAVVPVAGFSSNPEYKGRPVFDAHHIPEFDGGSVVLNEHHHVEPAVLNHLLDESLIRYDA
jgi:hypothetical protein